MSYLAIYGLRRSGNHAILEWMISNFSQTNQKHVIKHRLITSGNSCYLNAINEYMPSRNLFIDYNFAKITFKNLIVTYEDIPETLQSDYTIGFKRVVILRDILNLVASRYKLMRNKDPKGTDYTFDKFMKIDEEFFNCWISHASAFKRNILIIKFEDWLSSKEKRNEIASSLGCKNIDCTNTVSFHGGGSSFSKLEKIPLEKDLLQRSEQVKLPNEILERIQKPDISNLRKKHGYIK